MFLSAALLAVCGPLPALAAQDDLTLLLREEREHLALYFCDQQLVEVATRHPKPISQVAENVTVVTAAEIEAMRARNLAEVLERVPGVFVSDNGRDFAAPSSLHIHGSDFEHLVVLVDGVRWNYVGSDFPETNQIPVEIIDRVEVIKGAASSAWGSALGGVVNIITKETGRTGIPTGSAAVSMGEHGTRRYHGEAAGRAGELGYYLFAGRRESDGLRAGRYFKDTSLFGKFSHPVSGRTRIGFEVGASGPEFKYLHLGEWDYSAEQDHHLWFYSAHLDSSWRPDLHFYLQVYGRNNWTTDRGRWISTGLVADERSFDDEQRGVNSRLVWERGAHTLVVGAEYLHRQSIIREAVARVGSPSLAEEILALYLNNTIGLGNFTVTPGLRYDRLTIGEDQVSPSLGATYRFSRQTILRASASRGFRKPALDLKETPAEVAAAFGYTVNPNLESEIIRTYQVGLESTVVPCLWVQATLFRHAAKEVWEWTELHAIANAGRFNRTGLEASFRTATFYDLSLAGNYTVVREQPEPGDSDNLYKLNLTLEYHRPDLGLLAQLFGNYVWWSESLDVRGESALIWDLAVRQRLLGASGGREASLFFKVHNLFNGDQYWHYLLPSAPRWVEAGLHLRF